MGEQDCPICLYPIQNEVVTQCGHSFCGDCILMVRERGTFTEVSCPYCRQKITVIVPRWRLSQEEIDSDLAAIKAALADLDQKKESAP